MARYVLAVLWFGLNVATACGQEVLDQASPESPGQLSAFAIRSNGSGGQVITTGVSGLLSQVQMSLAKDAETTHPLIIDIMPTAGDVPVFDESSRLARRIVQPAEIPTFSFPPPSLTVSFGFSGVFFSAGDRFAVVLRTDSGIVDAYEWYTNSVDTYPGGAAFTLNSGTTNRQAVDFQFRTFVTIVPEPSSGCLAIVSIVGLAAVRLTNSCRRQHLRNV